MLGFGLSWAGICGVRLAAWYLYPSIIYSHLPASSSLAGGTSTSMLPARLRPVVWLSYMGRVTSGIKKGRPTGPYSQFGTQQMIPRLRERARPQRLPSRSAYKPAEQERLYFHLNADRAVRRHVAPDRALATKGLIKCKHYHVLRDQQHDGRHDVTIRTRSRERRKGSMRDHSWDGQAYFLLPTSRGNKRLGQLP